MIRLIFILTSLTFLLNSCTHDNSDEFLYTYNENLLIYDSLSVNSQEIKIQVPIVGHQLTLETLFSKTTDKALSDKEKNEIKVWWDSLPKPLQSKIKSSEIDIELVSKVKISQDDISDNSINSNQVIVTGKALEEIIGSETDLRYTVSTLKIEESNSDNEYLEENITDIRLVQEIPVKLNEFSTQVFLRDNYISNDNIKTLQYWWINLPQDLRNKVLSKELYLNLQCNTILDVEANEKQSDFAVATANENLFVTADILNKVIGVQKINNREIGLAAINTKVKVETATKQNFSYPAKSYINISLTKNTSNIKLSSPTL